MREISSGELYEIAYERAEVDGPCYHRNAMRRVGPGFDVVGLAVVLATDGREGLGRSARRGRAVKSHMAVAQDEDPIRAVDDTELVRREEDRTSVGHERRPERLIDEVTAHMCIHSAEHVVEEVHVRVGIQRAR